MSVNQEQLDLYWATGCTSCLRAKEFLERNDVPFASHNVAEDMDLLDEMEKRGLPRRVPVVERGDDWVDAQDLEAVARIAGVEHEAEPLPVDELYRRLGIVLETVEGYAEEIPADELGGTFANRPRTIGELVYHTFSIPESFLEHEAGAPMKSYKPEPEWANRSTEALTTYGQHIQVRLRDWYEGPGSDRDWTATADVYYGDPTVHQFFERTTWHAGQHARQLEWVLEERLDVDPEPLGAELWDGLPMPEQVWNDGSGGDPAEPGAENILESVRSS